MDTKVTITYNLAGLTLPDLGDKYFWRVIRGTIMDSVELRKKVWFFSVSVQKLGMAFYKEVDGRRVPREPGEAVTSAANFIAREVAYSAKWDGVYGDYTKS